MSFIEKGTSDSYSSVGWAKPGNYDVPWGTRIISPGMKPREATRVVFVNP